MELKKKKIIYNIVIRLYYNIVIRLKRFEAASWETCWFGLDASTERGGVMELVPYFERQVHVQPPRPRPPHLPRSTRTAGRKQAAPNPVARIDLG